MPKMADLLRDGTISDPFFEVLNDGDWNACIGKQGDQTNYVEGYLQAAQLLVDTLLEKRLYGSRDTLAMPILYNARHGLELALKYILRELVAIGMASARAGADDHDLRAYWEHLSAQRIGDLACRDQLTELKPFVESFMQKDIDGQELRYFENREGKQSLEELAVVNLPLMQAAIEELRDIVQRLMDRAFRLGQEHLAGTKTKECSRSDLIAIARIVGPQTSWSEDSFLDRKAEAMARFDLTSNGFSRALTAIKDSRELKVLIGLDTPLTYLTADKALEITQRWLDAHPPKPAAEATMIDAATISFDDITDYGDTMRVLNDAALAVLSVEELADLQTIFYIGRDRRYGEEYPAYLAHTLKTHQLDDRRYEKAHHILSKLNFIDGFVDGLRRVGQPSLADQVAALRAQAQASAG
jgi:hypothetical protein